MGISRRIFALYIITRNFMGFCSRFFSDILERKAATLTPSTSEGDWVREVTFLILYKRPKKDWDSDFRYKICSRLQKSMILNFYEERNGFLINLLKPPWYCIRNTSVSIAITVVSTFLLALPTRVTYKPES